MKHSDSRILTLKEFFSDTFLTEDQYMLPKYFPCAFLWVRFWLGQGSRFRMASRIGMILFFCFLETLFAEKKFSVNLILLLYWYSFCLSQVFQDSLFIVGVLKFHQDKPSVVFAFVFNLGPFT